MEAETPTPWISPDVVAAQEGEQVEMGKELPEPLPVEKPPTGHTAPEVIQKVQLGDGMDDGNNAEE